MKNFKMLMAGVIIGSTVTLSVSVMADLPRVQAYLAGYSIKVDGSQITIPSDMAVLNYNDRAYVPTKLIVEAMGGSTAFDARTGTITISKPQPVVRDVVKEVPVEVVKEVPVEVIKEVEKKVYVQAEQNYSYVPLASSDGPISMYVKDMFIGSNITTLYVETTNIGQSYAIFDYANFSIEANGTKVSPRDNYGWGNSIDAATTSKSMSINFEKIPDNATSMIVVLPYKLSDNSNTRNLTFYINIRR